MIKGKIRIKNNSKIYRQSNFLASFESEIEFLNSRITDITLSTGQIIFHLLSSKFKMEGSTIDDIDCGAEKEESIF